MRLLFPALLLLAPRGAAAQANYLPLPLGSVQRAALANASMLYLSLDVPMPFTGLHISLISSYGNSDIFVAVAGNGGTGTPAPPLTPSPAGGADYSATSPLGTDLVNILPTDLPVRSVCIRTQRAGQTCRFIVGLRSVTSAAGAVVSTYVDGMPRPIPYGTPLVDTLTPGALLFYSYSLSSSSSSVSFALTAYSGIPNMYIATGDVNTTPRGDIPGSFCASAVPATSDGTSTVRSYGLTNLFPGGACAAGCNGLYPCNVTLGITSIDYGVFSITPSEGAPGSPTGVITLHDSIPVRSEGTAVSSAPVGSNLQLFDFTFVPDAVSVTAANIVTVTLSQFTGTAPTRLYASWDVPPPPISNAPSAAVVVSFAAVQVPTPSKATYSSITAVGSSTLTIARDDPAFVASCGSTPTMPCTLHIALAATSSTVFGIVARTDTGIALSEGIPMIGEALASSSQPLTYFRFTRSYPDSSIVIAVTPLSGPVDVFVSNSANAPSFIPPTPASNYWNARSLSPSLTVAASAIIVNPYDAGACSAPCVYYIGVRAGGASLEGQIISFSVLVHARGLTTSALLDGQPTMDALVGPTDINTFAFPLPLNAPSVTLSFAPLTGAPVTLWASANGVMPGLGGAGSQFSLGPLAPLGVERTLTLSRSDPRVWPFCTAPAYSVVNTTRRDCIDVAASGKCGTTCIDRTGSNLCINTTVPVTTRTLIAGAPIPCTLKFAATSGGGLFSLVAVTGPRMLQDGVGTLVSISPGASVQLVFEAAARATRVKIALSPQYGRVIASVSTSPPGTPDAKSVSFGGIGSYVLVLDAAMAGCHATAPRCVFYVSLAAFSAAGPAAAALASALVRVQGSSVTVVPLDINAPTPGTIVAAPGTPGSPSSSPGAQWVYYSFTLRARDVSGIDVMVESTRGDGGWVLALVSSDINPVTGIVFPPSLSCATQNVSAAACPPASQVASNVAASAQGAGARTVLSVTPSTPGYAPGATFVLGLTSALDTDFIVTLRPVLAEPVTLLNGVPLHDSLAGPTSSAFYSVTLPAGSAPAPILLQATAIEGYVALYLSAGLVPTYPTPTNNSGSSGYADNYRFALSSSVLSSHLCPQLATADCIITLGAYPMPTTHYPVSYGIVATVGSTSTTPALLQAGVPQIGSASAGALTYFYAPLPANGLASGLFLSLVEIVGSTVMMANFDGTSASEAAGASTVAATSPKIISILPNSTLATAFPNANAITISVLGVATWSQFYITLSFASTVTELPDGAAVLATAAVGSYAFFSLPVPASLSDVQVALTTFSGSTTLYGSQWYVPGSTPLSYATQTFRPLALPASAHAFTSNFEGSLFIQRVNPSACVGACTYIFGAFCNGTIPCAFQVSATATSASLTRLSDGVPSQAMGLQGSYRYFMYDGGTDAKNITITAQALDGVVQIFVTNAWLPGLSPASSLPNLNASSSFLYASAPDDATVVIPQAALPPWVPSAGVVGATSTRSNIYVIAVYVAVGPSTFSVVARPAGTPVVLQPGVPSANHVTLAGNVDLYLFDNQDLAHDIYLDVSLLYGAVTVSATTRLGVSPTCTIVPPPIGSGFDEPAIATCLGATWQVASTGSRALLRISAANPCGPPSTVVTTNGAGAVAPCSPMDWRAGDLSIAVTTTLNALYTIFITTGADDLRALDGYPLDFTQGVVTPATPLVTIMFSTIPDAVGSPIYITMASDTKLASFNWFLSSCRDSECIPSLMHPSPSSFLASGFSDAGARDTVMVGSIGAASRAFCTTSGVLGDVCNYFLTLVPSASYCAASASLAPGGPEACIVHADVTFYASGGAAPIRVDYAQLKDRLVVLSGTLRAAGPTPIILYINRPGAPPEDTVDLALRLDACDSLRSHAVAWGCTPGGCLAPTKPTSTDYQYALLTLSTGFDRLIDLGEPANILYFSMSSLPFASPNRTLASDKAMTLYGPSTYSLQITDGAAARLRLPDAVGMAAASVVRVNASCANVTWPSTVTTIYNALGSPNVTAVGVTYIVYWAPGSFSSYASSVLNVSTSELAIMPSTACGLERWADLVVANFTPIVIPPGAPLNVVLNGLVPGAPYRINIVAKCTDDCLALNYDALGVPRPSGAQSTQKLAYAPTIFSLKPDPPRAPGMEVISAALFGIGVFVVVIAVIAALAMGFTRAPLAAGDAKFASVEQGDGIVSATGPGGRVVRLSRFSHFWSARELRAAVAGGSLAAGGATTEAPGMSLLRGGSAGAGAPAAGGEGGAGGAAAELEELARITGRVAELKGGAEVGGAVAVSVVGSPAPTDWK